jgi:hypothetical protein
MLHIGRTSGENGGPSHSAASAFQPSLPAFPDVSAYVDGVFGENEAQPREGGHNKEEADPVKQRDGKGRTTGQIDKAAAKKHREIIKDRMKNVSRPHGVDLGLKLTFSRPIARRPQRLAGQGRCRI